MKGVKFLFGGVPLVLVKAPALVFLHRCKPPARPVDSEHGIDAPATRTLAYFRALRGRTLKCRPQEAVHTKSQHTEQCSPWPWGN